MSRFASCFLIALFACSSKGGGSGTGSAGKPVDPPPASGDVSVELAAVTLGDDCGGNLPPPAPATKTADAMQPASASQPPPPSAPAIVAPAKVAPPGAAEIARPADCGGPDCGSVGRRGGCDQTSMQLAFHPTGATPSKIEVKKVELLDSTGALVGELKVNAPMKWSEADNKYAAWDQTVAPGSDVSASYVLASPDYNKLGGRWEAHNKTFQLRVTIVVEGKQRTVEKKAIAPTQLEPAVPT